MALSTIRGFAEILEEELDSVPSALRDLRCIQDASERITELVSQLEDHATTARHLATVDELTGIANRRCLFQYGNRLVEDGGPLAVVVLDVDQFKQINDRFGHHTGDAILKLVVERFKRAVRDNDLLARLSGDEFVALLPGTDEDGALIVARRLRHALIDHPFTVHNRRITVTCSIGVAVRGPEHIDLTELLDTADNRMYRAKRAGRDRVAC